MENQRIAHKMVCYSEERKAKQRSPADNICSSNLCNSSKSTKAIKGKSYLCMNSPCLYLCLTKNANYAYGASVYVWYIRTHAHTHTPIVPLSHLCYTPVHDLVSAHD